ncbi:ATP-binding protein [Paenibacillus koleovorans]|uniref:ATP-binding protein n=1 Tax=Paenibacillus koleovorans TaxID=121608 RepID=UPI001FEC7A0D|nr:ATP-binding protein [Paenibacillus koleovorans]
MSIKAKLAISISLIVAVILSLNVWINYISTNTDLQYNAEQQMMAAAEQIGATLKASSQAKQHLEDSMAEKLRMASIAIKERLDPDIAKVENSQLVALSEELGVEGISLWKQVGDDILVLKSSDPRELYLSSKTWDYWHTAFQQLFDHRFATIPQGLKQPNYWSGPINYATSDPTKIKKWGNYYDGTTNYMINPCLDATSLMNFEKQIGAEEIITKTLRDNPNILEITGIDPQFFGKPPHLELKQGITVYNLDVRAIVVGEYAYQSLEFDNLNVQRAVSTGTTVISNHFINKKQVMKSFVPTGSPSAPSIVAVVFDRESIHIALMSQLVVQSMVSLGLVLLSMIASYFCASFMTRGLSQIVRAVNEMAEGKFGTPIPVGSKDELGRLAESVNAMASNLQSHMSRLKDAAEELRNTKEYLESFFAHTSDAIHVSDLEGKVLTVNHAFESMYGWSRGEAFGRPLPIVPEELAEEYQHIRRKIERGASVTDYETVRSGKDGSPLDVSITISPIRNDAGDIVAMSSISRNITAKKQTEEVLRRSEKLSLVGQLAAGVAHEIRNPLTTLRGFIQLQQKRGVSSSYHLDIMLSELDRINFIVSEFLVLAKPQVNKFVEVDLRDTMQDILLLLDSQANMSNVQIETRFAPELPPLTCEANQLKQVFLNVLKNGMEAMPEGGQLTIELFHAVTPRSDDLVVRIIDEGCGIPQDEIAHLGEPFYTRKESGTGLGLMVSQQIIANHKGTMRFESELGIGTTVEIRLPLAAIASPNRPAPRQP